MKLFTRRNRPIHGAAPSTTAIRLFKDPTLFENVPLVVDTRNLLSGLFPMGGGPRRVVKA